jgi:hypothetical protein
MKRGLKVKTGVRAPAPILHSTDEDVDKPIPYRLADFPPCPTEHRATVVGTAKREA